jgi:hypothetical protein
MLRTDPNDVREKPQTPRGLMALKIAKFMGAGLVIGSSTNEARRARLKEFGRSIRVRRTLVYRFSMRAMSVF